MTEYNSVPLDPSVVSFGIPTQVVSEPILETTATAINPDIGINDAMFFGFIAGLLLAYIIGEL